MDKLTHYRETIKRSLDDFAKWANNTPPQDTRLLNVFDDAHGYYLLLNVQWGEFKRIRSALVFVRIANDKIYIEEDWTEEGIVTDLIAAGIPKQEIVMGFHDPALRPFTEFATG